MAVQNTVGDRDHRGQGLAKALKAAMILRVRRECSEVGRMITMDAHANAGMLALNDQLGFTPTEGTVMWQVRVDDLRDLA